MTEREERLILAAHAGGFDLWEIAATLGLRPVEVDSIIGMGRVRSAGERASGFWESAADLPTPSQVACRARAIRRQKARLAQKHPLCVGQAHKAKSPSIKVLPVSPALAGLVEYLNRTAS